MLKTNSISDLISSKENNETSKLTYISTYSMGKIGIKKIVDDPYKTPIDTDNKLLIQPSQIINNNTNNTNNNTNNTNTNTNSNTNNNSSKNKDIQTSKKKLKNKHSISPNIIHTRIQSSSSNSKYYSNKNKTSQRINIIKKNNSKQSLTQLRLPKKEFSKSSNNFYIYTNNNTYNKNNKYTKGKSYSKKKSNSNNKLIKERKITDGQLKSHSYHSSCIFSSMSPSSIKREKKKYSISNIIPSESNLNNNNSFKRDISEIYLKNNNNLSSTDINPNTLKLVLKEDYNKDNININFEQKYQKTEANINYLRVRRRPDFQKHLNNDTNTNTNSNNNNDTPKNESTQILNNERTKQIISSTPSSCIFDDKNKN